MSNQLIKTTELGKENVFPRTRILDLFDDTSGLKLIDILRSFNMMFVPYLGNKSYTRNQISPELRRQGLWLTYVIDNTVYTEWYDEVAIDDTNWGSDSNWRQGSNALVGDLSISPNGTWVINGEDSGITIKGDKGDSPVIRIYDNKILVSYDKGVTYEDLNNTPIYTKFRFNSLTNTYLVSYDLGANWLDISNEKVYHKFKYNLATNTYLESTDFGKTWSNISAEKVYTKFRFNRSTNTYQVSTDLGLNWTDISSDKVYYQFRYNGETNTHLVSTDFGTTWTNVSEDKVFYLFRTNDNRLLVSTDLGTTWENCSEPIAAWFRWADTSGTGNVGKVLISRDNNTWEDLSPTMTNNLYIKGYVAAVGNLPSNAAIGDIYMVGPTYDESDTTLDYPHYRMWVKLSSGWVDNGEYLSNVLMSLITGLETGITMSLKAITTSLDKRGIIYPEIDYIYQILDTNLKLIHGIDHNGKHIFPKIKNYSIADIKFFELENPEYIYLEIDKNYRILKAQLRDGSFRYNYETLNENILDFSNYKTSEDVVRNLRLLENSISGKTIKLPRGIIVNIGTLTFKNSTNFSIDGNGCILMFTGTMSFTNCENWELKNCILDFSNVSAAETLLVRGVSNNYSIDHNTIIGGRDAVNVGDPNYGKWETYNGYYYRGGGIDICGDVTTPSSNIWVTNNIIKISRLNGILIHCNCHNYYIIGNLIDTGANIGIEIEGRIGGGGTTSEHRCSNGIIANNIVKDKKDWNMLIDFADNITIIGNICEGGISNFEMVGCTKAIIDSNYFLSTGPDGFAISPEIFGTKRGEGSLYGDDSYTLNSDIICTNNIIKGKAGIRQLRINGVALCEYITNLKFNNNLIITEGIPSLETAAVGLAIASCVNAEISNNTILVSDKSRYGIAIGNNFMTDLYYKDKEGVPTLYLLVFDPDERWDLKNVRLSNNQIISDGADLTTSYDIGSGHVGIGFLDPVDAEIRNLYTKEKLFDNYTNLTIDNNIIDGFKYSFFIPKASDNGSLLDLRDNNIIRNCQNINIIGDTTLDTAPNINSVPVGYHYFDKIENKIKYKASNSIWI